jgi:hypothetical protein
VTALVILIAAVLLLYILFYNSLAVTFDERFSAHRRADQVYNNAVPFLTPPSPWFWAC